MKRSVSLPVRNDDVVAVFQWPLIAAALALFVLANFPLVQEVTGAVIAAVVGVSR